MHISQGSRISKICADSHLFLGKQVLYSFTHAIPKDKICETFPNLDKQRNELKPCSVFYILNFS